MRRSVWLPIAVVAVALVVAYFARSRPGTTVAPASDSGPKVMLEEMGPAPALTLEDLNGEAVSLSDYEGKLVLVNLWATWCSWCTKEIPELIELNDRYADQGFVVLGVALDDEGKEKVAPAAEAMEIDYPVLLDPLGAKVFAVGLIQSPGVPHSFLVDRRGQIRADILGYLPGPVIEEAVQVLLAEAPG